MMINIFQCTNDRVFVIEKIVINMQLSLVCRHVHVHMIKIDVNNIQSP